MLRLILGVLDVAYSDAGGGGATTTGQVAEILEQRYQPMQIFAVEREEKIGNWVAESLADVIKDVAAGAPVPRDPLMDAEQKIETEFRKFLLSGEIERIHPDLPSKAAIERRTKRRKSGKGPRRPSLIDTGLYMQSFRCWSEP